MIEEVVVDGVCSRCKQTTLTPCFCEKRKVFRQCLAKWVECTGLQASRNTSVTVESPTLCSRKHEEYVADFELVCRRALEPLDDPNDAGILRKLKGALDALKADMKLTDWRLRAQVELTIGEAILNQKPYSVYPPSTYFVLPVQTILHKHHGVVERGIKKPR